MIQGMIILLSPYDTYHAYDYTYTPTEIYYPMIQGMISSRHDTYVVKYVVNYVVKYVVKYVAL